MRACGPGLAAMLMLAGAAPAPGFAAGGCAAACEEAPAPGRTREAPPSGAQDPAQCEGLMKQDRLALALFAVCHSFAAPSDRLCADYSAACARLRAAGCAADWACD